MSFNFALGSYRRLPKKEFSLLDKANSSFFTLHSSLNKLFTSKAPALFYLFTFLPLKPLYPFFKRCAVAERLVTIFCAIVVDRAVGEAEEGGYLLAVFVEHPTALILHCALLLSPLAARLLHRVPVATVELRRLLTDVSEE